MNAIIQEAIPAQNFEIVRDFIGAILKVELENQKSIQGFDEPVSIWQERISQIGNEERIFINVFLASANYSGMTQKDTQGRTLYVIDIYSNGIASDTKTADLDSAIRLHKWLGMIRYILEYSEYKTLGLPLGIIGGGSVDEFGITEPSLSEDTGKTRQARIGISYRVQENQSLVQGVPLEINGTKIKIALSEQGYSYEFNN